MRFSLPSLLFALGFLLASCKNISFGEDDDSHGLTLVSLRLTSENYGRLNAQLFSKRPADANIQIRSGMDVNCRISYAGRSTLDAYRKSFDLHFCKERYKGRSLYRLSAQNIDRTMVRAILGYSAFRKMGLDAPEAEPVSAYINREYLGLYLLLETVDDEFFRAHGRSVRDIYKARYGNASFKQELSNNLPEAFSYEGSPDNFTLLAGVYEALWKSGSDDEFSEKIDRLLDVDAFLAYMATALYIAHWDGFDNNYFLVFDSGKNRLVTVPWDLDRIWEKTDSLGPEGLVNRNELLLRFLKIERYRQKFAAALDRVQELYPLQQILDDMRHYQGRTAEAYRNDPVLNFLSPQDKVFEELESRITSWDARVKEYRGTLDP